MNRTLVITCFTFMLALAFSVANAEPFGADGLPTKKRKKGEKVQLTADWDGKVRDRALQSLKPKGGFITDAKTLKQLWQSWSVGNEVPTIDFEKELVLVATVPGPNRARLFLTLSKKGNIKMMAAGTRIGGPGFGYAIVTVSRKGVKSVNGKSITGSPKGEFIKVEVQGKLTTGIMAIGGETTGILITANGITWELDFGKNSKQRKQAESWSGKQVQVTGQLTRRKGVEIRERWIVDVKSISQADK